jgi:hypothetical protein
MEFTTGPSMYGPYDVVPAADRIFEAKISDVFHFGFTLEAYIDNKPLRGLLFSYKPGFAHAAHNYVSRKKAAEEAAMTKVLEQRRQERKVARLAKLQVKRAAAEAAALAAAATVQPPMPPLVIIFCPAFLCLLYIKFLIFVDVGFTSLKALATHCHHSLATQ